MHLSHMLQYTIEKRNMHIILLNGVLWDMGHVHCGIYEIDLITQHVTLKGRYINET